MFESDVYISVIIHETTMSLNYKINNIKIGEEAYAGCLRYYGREEISREEYKLEILRKFLKSALLTYYSFNKLLDEKKYDCVVYSHGIYVPHGIINQILKNKNIRSVVYIPSYRKNTFIFSHNDTYHRTMIDEENIKLMIDILHYASIDPEQRKIMEIEQE